MSSTLCRAAAATSDKDGDTSTVIRMLALHGKGGSGDEFSSRLGNYHEILQNEFGTTLEVTSVDAPVSLDEGGFAWWSLAPGERSFTANVYEQFETSSDIIQTELIRQPKSLKEPQQANFDVVYGHSQGAILIAALLALNRIPVHPKHGYILNGVAWPNPYAKELEALDFAQEDTPPPRVLFITGGDDRINPPESQEKVKASLEMAGADVTQIQHPGGHNIPTERDGILRQILDWIVSV